MVTNVFFATTILFMALGFFLLEQCEFLIPFRTLIVEKYGPVILVFATLLFLNIYAALSTTLWTINSRPFSLNWMRPFSSCCLAK